MVFEQTICQLQIITEVRLPFVTLDNCLHHEDLGLNRGEGLHHGR